MAEAGTNQTTPAPNWRELDKAHHLHPFTDLAQYAKAGGPVFSQARHIYITDSDGREILDGMSGLWCCNLGYSQAAIVAAVTQQLQKLPYYNSFFGCSNEAAVELASKLVDVTPPQFNHFFFSSSGSEANDTNIRLVHRYFDLLGKPNKKQIISRQGAYHGSTIAAASLGGMSKMHEQVTGLSYIHHAMQPYWYKDGGDMSPDEFGLVAARSVEKKIEELGADNVAAFIGEPIQGAGGVIVPPSTYWPEIRRICTEHDVLLISDEVICGFGRLGAWFGADVYETEPDLMTFAKAITGGYQPLGGVAVSDKLADVLTSSGGEFAHGYTYSGHPAACAAGIATLGIMQEGGVNDYAANELAPHLNKRAKELADHPIVGEVRTKGVLAAFELVRDKQSRERLAPDSKGALYCRDAAIGNQVMVRAVGDTMITAPPLVCSTDEIDLLIERFVKALDATAAEYGIAA